VSTTEELLEINSSWSNQSQTQEVLHVQILHSLSQPIAVAAQSKARTVFARSNTEIVGSNSIGGMDVCVCSVCVYSVST
jgi:hypothetical protein